ncbi:hypothetical protein CSQ88_22010 [Iodobacter sp. BJB302]|nr:hypothetical protein CSQ88_22010 [Iodobacter sp. BJB302]
MIRHAAYKLERHHTLAALFTYIFWDYYHLIDERNKTLKVLFFFHRSVPAIWLVVGCSVICFF